MNMTKYNLRFNRSSVLNNLFTFMIRDALTEYSYLGQMAGLFYSLKPNKMGVELSIRGYSENQDIYLGNILSVIYGGKTFSNEDRFEDVFEMHKKGIESSEADPLKSQVKFLLCSILCPRTFLRRERMKVRMHNSPMAKKSQVEKSVLLFQALAGITLGDVAEYAEAFLTRHCTEVRSTKFSRQGRAKLGAFQRYCVAENTQLSPSLI